MRILSLCLVTLFSASVVLAHHTLTAVAPVVSGIVIDGDLSDWPDNVLTLPIARSRFGAAADSVDDLQAWFRVAHDPDSSRLYVAVEMVDDSPVVSDTATAWNASDACEIFLDFEHGDRTSGCIQHVLYGRHHEVFTQGDVNDDSTAGIVSRAYRDGRHVFEWRFDLGQMAGVEEPPGPGDVIGFDVSIGDRDADESFTWMAWGDGIGKLGAPSRRGDLALLPAQGGGRITGRVAWSHEGQGVPPRRVQIQSDQGWLRAAVDADGVFDLLLPPGSYEVATQDLRIGRTGRRATTIEVSSGSAVKVPDLIVDPVQDKGILVGELFDHLGPEDPGAAVLIAHEGKLLHEGGYGLADVEHAIPNTPRTRFRLASVSKQFTALAVMQLVEAGRIDLDVPLITYLPDYPRASEVTTRQLMTHQSGIPNYLGDSEFWAEAALGRDMAELLDVFQHKDLDFEPGSRYSYSNSAYVVLAHLLETVSGLSFEEYLQRNIFDPVGMDDTGVDQYRAIVPDRAHGYSTSGDGIINTWWLDMYLLTGAGNLYSTVRDLLRWDQALYTQTVLQRETLQQTYTPATLNDGNETAYGLGWRIGEVHGLPYIGHSGSINGFTTQIYRYTRHGYTVIVLANNPRLHAGEVARQISEIYLSDQMTWPTAVAAGP
ncbi:MAG: serine hydrolase [Gemmatimonadetes bacterium]|jgi:CubicO group peptidase (beta-lactamase class C family)|nr:serine hydrolase [Gemmatimonadota bacterium]MBT6144447.1 serine hydrolase [Gemmatimonadota bacterium]MBT7863963.1 serine hydrolase [Gemmatimonadota bacterium]